MSDLSEKLARPEATTHGAARATLVQLRKRWGTLQVVEGPEYEPAKLLHVGMGAKLSVWRKVSGRGESAVFELEREE